MTTVGYSTLPYFSLFDKDKTPLTNGYLYFFDQNTRLPKAVFSDPAGQIAYVNPIQLNSAAWVPPLYAQDDSPYFVQAFNSDMNLVWTFNNFMPPSGGSGDVTISQDYNNLIINGQFTFFEQKSWFPAPTIEALIAPDAFYFRKDGSITNDTLAFELFGLGDSPTTFPDGTPIYYLDYTCPSAAINETIKDFYYKINNVRALQNTIVTYSFWAKAPVGTNPQVEILIYQEFGSGGSPSPDVITPVQTFTLTNNWVKYSVPSYLVPQVTGTLGTNGDDHVVFTLRFPLNQICEVQLTNIFLKLGGDLPEYPYQTYSEVNAQLSALRLPVPSITNYYDSVSVIPVGFNGRQPYGAVFGLTQNPPIGTTIMWSFRESFPLGWYWENGQNISRYNLGTPLFNLCGYDYTATDGYSLNPVSTNQLTIISDNLGVGMTPVNTTPFTITYTPGSSTTREVINITFTAASGLANNSYIQLFGGAGAGNDVVIWYNKIGYNTFPSSTGMVYVQVKYVGNETDTQLRDLTQTVLSQLMIGDGIRSIDTLIVQEPTTTTNTMNVFSYRAGVVLAPPNAGNSGFTFTVTTTGSSTTYETTQIQTVPASALMPNSYFTLSSLSDTYLIYFLINGVGTEPTITSSYSIPIPLTGNETAIQIAVLLQTYLNLPIYSLPDSRGLFIKGVTSNTTSYWRADPGIRQQATQTVSVANAVGSLEQGDFQAHTHTVGPVVSTGSVAPTSEGGPLAQVANTLVSGSTGGSETRPNNMSKYFLIRVY